MSDPPLFPSLTRSYIEQCRFSSWQATFARISPRATVIRPLSAEFREYLEEDGVMIPEGSEDFPATSSLSDVSDSDDEYSVDPPPKRYSFPELDEQIREAIMRYHAVFPKLNWTSPKELPKDASWILPTLKCTSPADVYLLLKSSDFVLHDLDPSLAFEGCAPDPSDRTSDITEHTPPRHELELVLKKWFSMDRGREFRCFTRDENLLGISQRDPNYYPHLNLQGTKDKITSAVSGFWTKNIRAKFRGGGDYVFDVHLTRDLSSAYLLDINPYHPKTDPLLFTYDELHRLLASSSSRGSTSLPHAPSDISPSSMDHTASDPELRVIASPSDPAASRSAPANQHNAVPFDALQLSAGNDISTFASRWEGELQRALHSDDTDSDPFDS